MTDSAERFDFSAPLPLTSRLTIPSRVLLSPMQGIMTETMLGVICRLRLVQCLLTPFYSTGGTSVPNPPTFRRKLLPYRDFAHLPIIFQLIGHEPDPIARTALGFAEAGVHGINLNFACPSKTVVGSGNGSACLKSDTLPAAVTAAVRKLLPSEVSLSVKIRTGWDSCAGLEKMVEGICGAGADLIICHYRTGKEMYDNVPDADSVRAERLSRVVAAAGDVPVFANGDIASYEDALRVIRQTGCSGVAIGRAFLQKPGMIRAIAANGTPPERISSPETFLNELRGNLAGISQKHRRGWYLECVRMTYGEDSPEFAEAVRHKSSL